jgi:hypothetical protein
MTKFTLIDNWRQAWKLASIRIFAVILILPDVYDYAHTLGWTEELPESFTWVVRGAALLGVVVRLLKQTEPVKEDPDAA